MLPQLLPLIDSIVNLLVELTPALLVILPIQAQIMTDGIKFMNAVGKPLIDAIKYIIDNGAAAVKWVRKIFGGGGEKVGVVEFGEMTMGGGAAPGGGAGGAGGGAPAPGGGKGGKDPILERIRIAKLGIELIENEFARVNEIYNLDMAMFARQLKLKEISQAEYNIRALLAEKARNDAMMVLHQKRFDEEQYDIYRTEGIIAQHIEATANYVADASVSSADILHAAITQNEEAITGIMHNIQSAASDMFGESREIAAAQAAINTYVAATKALEAGPILGPILMASTLIAGMAQVAKIYATKPGSRPSGGGGAPSMGTSSPNMQSARIPAGGARQSQIVDMNLGGQFELKGSDLFLSINRQMALEMGQTL